MKNTKLRLALLFTALTLASTTHANPIDFIFGAGSFGRKCGTTGDTRHLIKRYVENKRFFKDETWKDRVPPTRNPNFQDDLDLLADNQYGRATLGIMDEFFDPEFDTKIFYTATAKPRPNGSIPVVDPECKALVVYLHGSGTKKASGIGAAVKANSLAKMGYCLLSFDMPFHANGSRNPGLANPEAYAKYMDDLINKYRVPKQKVILMGHSFGPDVIAEYITRYPHGVDSAVLVSPGSFDKVTQRWYKEKTSQMDFGDTEMNRDGGAWAGMVTRGKLWDKPDKRVDPTVANDELDIYVISGDREEYIPGPLDPITKKPNDEPRTYDVAAVYKGYFSRVDVTIEPGVGHYIFNHTDANGHDVVLRSVLKAGGDDIAKEKELRRDFTERMARRANYELFAVRYQKEPFFRNYVDRLAASEGKTGIEIVQDLIKSQDRVRSQDILGDYLKVEAQRTTALNANIKKTQKWAPSFYQENREAIEALGIQGNDPTPLHSKYLAFLEKQSPSEVRQHTSVPDSVFVLPKKGPNVRDLVDHSIELTKEMKAEVMKDPQLRTFVSSRSSEARNDFVSAIASMKAKDKEISNEQIIKLLKEHLGEN